MGQYFDNDDLESNLKTFKTIISDQDFSFNTDNGVFSKKGLDFGTRILLESIDVNNLSGDILDVGCGYGPISIIVAKLNPEAKVLGVDINSRAIHLSKMNKKLNRVKNVDFINSNVYEKVSGLYQTIISNPPIRAGKEIVYKILFEAKDHLMPDGNLYAVIHKDQGARSAVKDLEKVYNVKVIQKTKGFFVINCKIV